MFCSNARAMKYLIDEDLANAVLTYLSHQPYRDVYELIRQMQTLPEVPEEPSEHPHTEPLSNPPNE